jgi:hypothetical protein
MNKGIKGWWYHFGTTGKKRGVPAPFGRGKMEKVQDTSFQRAKGA